MKHFFIFAVAVFTSNNLIMAQPAYNRPLFEQYNFQLLLKQEDNNADHKDIYLIGVQLWEPVFFSSPVLDSVKLEKAFVVSYTLYNKTTTKRYISHIKTGVIAVFFKSDDRIYKIMESGCIVDMASEEIPIHKPHKKKGRIEIEIVEEPRQISFQSFPSEYTFVGYSNDTTLFCVRAWEYIKEHFDNENEIWEKE